MVQKNKDQGIKMKTGKSNTLSFPQEVCWIVWWNEKNPENTPSAKWMPDSEEMGKKTTKRKLLLGERGWKWTKAMARTEKRSEKCSGMQTIVGEHCSDDPSSNKSPNRIHSELHENYPECQEKAMVEETRSRAKRKQQNYKCNYTQEASDMKTRLYILAHTHTLT